VDLRKEDNFDPEDIDLEDELQKTYKKADNETEKELKPLKKKAKKYGPFANIIYQRMIYKLAIKKYGKDMMIGSKKRSRVFHDFSIVIPDVLYKYNHVIRNLF